MAVNNVGLVTSDVTGGNSTGADSNMQTGV